ncbi:hypothetical protein HW509_03095 [Asaia spathodeae]|uniref:hypothetical protein n=1 Tax=Asaia spathodeae TaxID=657016 RepID=UPI002FC2B5CC
MNRFYRTGLSAGFLGLALLSGCAEPSQPQPVAQVPTRQPPQDFAPGMTTETPPANEAQLTNDPSAPTNTPLCGAVQQETNRMGGQVFPDGISSGSTCPQNACFNPLTGTYIAATGAPSVCR